MVVAAAVPARLKAATGGLASRTEVAISVPDRRANAGRRGNARDHLIGVAAGAEVRQIAPGREPGSANIKVVTEVTLTAENGRTLTPRRMTSPDEGTVWAYEATFTIREEPPRRSSTNMETGSGATSESWRMIGEVSLAQGASAALRGSSASTLVTTAVDRRLPSPAAPTVAARVGGLCHARHRCGAHLEALADKIEAFVW